jgi:LIVCS family branched-chain amino acid:cation transporter
MIAGSAIFSMLFGSGNIVFPLMLGKMWGGDWFIPLIGWLIAAVAIPMLGFYGAMLYDGERQKLLAPIGKHCSFALVFIVMMLVGPFGVVARVVNVSFGGFGNLLPQLPFWVFSAVYVFLAVLVAYRPDKIISVIGIIFTPLKFGGLAAIVIGAMYIGGQIPSSSGSGSACTQLTSGFGMGYQTMDLLASVLFASNIYLYMKNSLPEADRNDRAKLLKFVGVACVIGALMLAAAYIGLLLIASQYSDQLAGVPDESLLGKIAELAMGSSASWFISVVIAISCFATAVMLCTAFTDYVHKDILKEKFNRTVVLVCVGAVAFIVSLLGFGQICSFLNMVLEKLYPMLMVFIAGRMVYYYAVINKKK